MKKKLTVNTLALGNLKQRRKQYTIMIIGIILAMVFSSSALFFMKSANDTYLEARSHEYGGQDFIVSIDGYSENDYKSLVKDGVVTEYGIAHIQGYAFNKDEDSGFCVGWLDDKATTLSKQTLIEGEMPKNENEIAVEKSVPLYLGMKDAGLGDTIKLNVSIPNGADYSKAKQKEYKIVGILEDKYSNLTYGCYEKEWQKVIPSIFVAQNSVVDFGGKENYSAYAMINRDFVKAYMKSLENSRGYGDSDALNDYLYKLEPEFTMNYFGFGGNFNFLSFDSINENGGYAFVLILILVFASCVIIANAFNTNLKDRKKQIGMLRAVGTTKRQVFKIFGREAFLISLIATPISIAISYVLVRIMLKLTSDTAVMNNSVWILFVCAVVNVAIVMLSALIPLARASKITPIQAIRNINNNRKIKTKKIKTKKEFVPSKHLAKRNLIFYKGSRTAVIVMLVITIVGTSFGASYASYGKNNLRSFYYDYSMDMADAGMSEADMQSVESLPYVDAAFGTKRHNIQVEINNVDSYIAALYPEMFMDIEHFDEAKDRFKNCIYNEWQPEALNEEKERLGMSGDPYSMEFCGFDERQVATLEDKLLDGRINYDKLASGEEVILVAPNRVQYKVKKEGHGAYASFKKYDDEVVSTNIAYKTFADEKRTINVGDEFRISFAEVDYDDEGNISSVENAELKTVKVGAIVSPNVVDSSYGFGIYNMAMITSLQGFNRFCPGMKYTDIGINVNCELNDDKDFEITEDLKAYQAQNGGIWVDDNYQYTKRQQNEVNAFMTTMYAVVILCFALCVSIINNSMSAQIRENKRVIGTLRAVGADEKELVKSYFNQMISTLGVGIGVGYGIFISLFFIIKFSCYALGANFGFIFNPILSLCMIVPLIIACTINLWSKVRKEMKNSIVENIREL